jgi:hypothetical protein
MAKKRQARKCGSHKTNGDLCPNWAMRGQEVCHAHGGRSPQAKAAAEERIAAAAAEQAARRFGLDMTEISGGEALLREVRRSAAMVDWLALQVAELKAEDLIWGISGRRITPSAEPGGNPQVVVEQRARVHPWVTMLGQERLVLMRVSEAAHRCGIEDRLMRVEELKGALIAKLIAAILNDPELEMRPEQRAKFGQVVPRHLRAIDGGDGNARE